MATSSILGGTTVPERHKGTGTDALGPSDSSDSGSDVSGERAMATGPDDPDNLGAVPSDISSDTDRFGTGERASATPGRRDREDGDILPDSIRTGPSDQLDFDSDIDVEELASGDDPSAGPDAEHDGDELEALDDDEVDEDAGQAEPTDARVRR
ncbi:hypothetical protein [Roseateles amylovorans]|uniref:Chemotaxis protein n=1 Tax=Roseateles amylovorans TaxID=2978473 RepID=A0ABY6B6L8_9BURK|nr:hypothetical protein [Roseateles amylovorans]UXH80569.1 hypothetical protein N4261_12130 [Roseateles amylovorans]